MNQDPARGVAERAKPAGKCPTSRPEMSSDKIEVVCMFCDKHLMAIKAWEIINPSHSICEKCLEMWEKSETRMVSTISEFRESLKEICYEHNIKKEP